MSNNNTLMSFMLKTVSLVVNESRILKNKYILLNVDKQI